MARIPSPKGAVSWWRPGLSGKEYNLFGDAYNDVAYDKLTKLWKKDVPASPYLDWVTGLSESGWMHLRLLVDFMSIGAAPQRWKDLDPYGPLDAYAREEREAERRERIARVKVSVMDYLPDGVEVVESTSAQDLKERLDRGITDENVQFRLFVVEDLSREVIEAFGHKFQIDPEFFRAHIVDFAWYNVRDRWRNPPLLDIARTHQNWMQLRYVTARYFDPDHKTGQEEGRTTFADASKEAERFNVLRRVDNDLSNKSFWDKDDAVVGLTRSRATFWLQPESSQQGAPVGILLLDPTMTRGVPLWRGCRALLPMPKYGEPVSSEPPKQDNLYERFVFSAQQASLFPDCTAEHPSKVLIPVQVLLNFVCSEWLTMSDYIKTRLSQLNWEIMEPKFFGGGKKGVYNMLEKLHVWRRFVPLHREMVSETIQHLDQFTDRLQGRMTPSGEGGLPSSLSPSPSHTSSHTSSSHTSSHTSSHNSSHTLLNHYRLDLVHVQSQLEEYQRRIDQLTSVVTAVISIDNSRRSLQDNRNIGRLTWLATFFIPLSLVAGILSMQSDVSEIRRSTFVVYFATSLPLGLVLAIAAVTLSLYQSKTQTKMAKLMESIERLWARQKRE